MGSPLPSIPENELHQHVLEACREAGLSQTERRTGTMLAALTEHYLELRRWNPRLSLVGPGTADQVLERHYGESLAALSLLGEADRTLVDIGSGAGFPGLVLAAARPDLEVTLVEPRQRKWAFLEQAARRGGLSCRCLNVRVECPLPAGFPEVIDVVTCRALTISKDVFDLILDHSPQARFLLWLGKDIPELPDRLGLIREIRLRGARRRRVVELST